MNFFKKSLFLVIFFLLPEVAYVARFPNVIKKNFEIPADFNSEFAKIIGLSQIDFGSTLQCPLSDNIEVGWFVTQKNTFRHGQDTKPTILNEVAISKDGNSMTIGQFWLDNSTGFPYQNGPRYSFLSKPFDDSSPDRMNCWVRINQYLLSKKKDEIILNQSSLLRRLFGRAQSLQVHRWTTRDGKTIIQIGLGSLISRERESVDEGLDKF